MVRVLLVLVVLLSLAAGAEAACRGAGLFRGRAVQRIVHRERIVDRGTLFPRLRGGSGCAGVTAGGCAGVVVVPAAPKPAPAVCPCVPLKK